MHHRSDEAQNPQIEVFFEVPLSLFDAPAWDLVWLASARRACGASRYCRHRAGRDRYLSRNAPGTIATQNMIRCPQHTSLTIEARSLYLRGHFTILCG